MPPSFPQVGEGGPYLTRELWVDGAPGRVVVLDQEPSQANRVEEALLAARDGGQIQLPLFELRAETSRGPVRLTSLEFPHRCADAYLRDSLVEGKRFDDSEVGRRLREVSVRDVRPLYERDPGSLVFGAWDSHRKGRWPRFARLYCSEVVGLDPLPGVRRATRMDPLNLVGAVDKAEVDGAWRFLPEGAKAKGSRLSELGHGNIAPSVVPGGVAIREARRSGWLSLAGLARLRFGDAPAEAATLARAALAALVLAGDRLAFGGPSLRLRSGCELVRKSETLAFERDGGHREPFELTSRAATAVFHELRDRAAAAGVAMATNTVMLTPMAALADAIEFAFTGSVDRE
jgi:CRISPR-associated protein Csb1